MLRTLDRVEEIERVRLANAMLLEIFDLTDDLAILLDDSGRLLHLNAAAKRFYALDDESAERWVGRNWEPANDRVDQVIMEIIEDPDAFVRWSGEIDAIRHDGRAVPMLVQLLAHRDRADGPIEFYSAVGRDISDQKLLESSLEQQATHDPLTGLPNRVLLFERIQRALDGLRSLGTRHSVALLFVDLDHFKAVNDSMGHELGDKILVTVADRISSVVRPGDTVARFGGDEFVVLCERLDHPEDAVVIAHRIDVALHEPVGIDEREMQLGVSIGISYADADDTDPSAVLRDADTAMYRAKESGAADGWSSTTTFVIRPVNATASRRRCVRRVTAKGWSCATSRSSTCRPAGSWGSRRSSGGGTAASSCRPTSSSPSPRTPG